MPEKPSSSSSAPNGKMSSRAPHPPEFKGKVQELQFGYLSNGKDMVVKKQLTSPPTAPENDPLQMTMAADLGSRRITIFFAMTFIHTPLFWGSSNHEQKQVRQFKMVINTSQLKTIFLEQADADNGRASWVTIPCQHPPLSLRKEDIPGEKPHPGERDPKKDPQSDDHKWVRVTYIFDNDDITQDFTVGLLTHWNDANFIDIGRWTTFRLRVDNDNGALHGFLNRLRAVNIVTTKLDGKGHIRHDASSFILPPENRAIRHRTFYQQHDPIVVHDDHGLSLLKEDHPYVSALPFPLQYQLEVCISHGVFNEHTLTREFLKRLRSMKPDRARHLLEYYSNDKKPIHDPMTIFSSDEAAAYYPFRTIPSGCTLIRKILVTPTTLYFNSPAVEASNRVLRRYSHLQEHFLRVQFVDEMNRGRLRSEVEDMDRDHFVFRRVFHALLNGIRIGDYHFKFLAFGNSQIRECSAYFFHEVDGLTCQNMREWMGNFDHIRVVAKCAARIGQCFSTTRQIQGIQGHRVTRIDDTERGGYCYTDGVGKISSFLAQLVLQEIGVDSSDTPSAFQFRMGGCKGVLAVWPGMSPMEIQIRPSQEKFLARSNGLEIVRMARHATASLNRQIITILSCLGVRPKVFVDLVTNQLANYSKAMKDRTAAASLLGIYIDENQTSLILKELVNWGFMDHDVEEPFVMTILQLWRSWSIKLLKEKARIVVEKSAFLLGCVDETGTLRGHSTASEGKLNSRKLEELPQIFFQIPDPDKPGEYRPMTGICLIGRNPSLHPGDIRVVQAVDCKPLHHLKSVVVFPGVGDRDLPSMLSGGDLDGDDFFVIWDPNLIPPQWNYPPMDYKAPAPESLDRDVNSQDLVQFFVKYMRSDCLPFIALSHLANADHLKGGAKHPICLKLASLHSKAVDFVKTGDPAVLTKGLRSSKWPHFMGGNRNNTYHSRSALGQVYDRVGNVPFKPAYDNAFDERILDKYKPDDEAMLEKIRHVKSQYDLAIRRLMAQREIGTEFEVWTGFVLSKPRVGSSYKISEDMSRETGVIKQHYREEIRKLAGTNHGTDLLPWVAAMYKVTHQEVQEALRKRQGHEGSDGDRPRRPVHVRDLQDLPLMSFPWMFHAQLGYIATGHWARDEYIDFRYRMGNLPLRDYHGDGNIIHQQPEGPVENIGGAVMPEGTMKPVVDDARNAFTKVEMDMIKGKDRMTEKQEGAFFSGVFAMSKPPPRADVDASTSSAPVESGSSTLASSDVAADQENGEQNKRENGGIGKNSKVDEDEEENIWERFGDDDDE